MPALRGQRIPGDESMVRSGVLGWGGAGLCGAMRREESLYIPGGKEK